MNLVLFLHAFLLTAGVDPVPGEAEVACESHFLQIQIEIGPRTPAADAMPAASVKEVEVKTLVPKGMDNKYLIAVAYSGVLALCAGLGFGGGSSKTPQDPRVKDGCSIGWWCFMASVYALVYYTSNQYAPSHLEKDLGGSQKLMSSVPVPMNLFVKAILGLLASGVSDHIGRRPVFLLCMWMLILGSFCCACATDIRCFILARILQSMGGSVEAVVIAMFRDYFPEPEDRMTNMAALQMIGLGGILLAPFGGDLCAKYLGWRSSFFLLAFMWLLMWLCAYASMEECCPDGPRKNYWKDVMHILEPQLICLLLSNCLIVSEYLTLNAQAAYSVDTHFGQSVMISSLTMLGFCVICGLGALFGDLIERPTLFRGKLAVSFLASSGIAASILAFHYPDSWLWAFLAGSFLQAIWMVPGQLAAHAPFLKGSSSNCAALAASFEILAQLLSGSLLSALATPSISFQPLTALTLWQNGRCIVAGLCWLTYGLELKRHEKPSPLSPPLKTGTAAPEDLQ